MLPLAVSTGILLLMLGGCNGKQEREAAYIERGRQHYAEGDFTKAALEFRNALQINPLGVESQYYLGLIAEQGGDLSAAFSAFTTVTEQDPKYIPAQLKIGQYALIQNDSDQALKTADLIIGLDAKNAEAHALRGAALLRLGQADAAMREALAAQSIDPKNTVSFSVVSSIRATQGDLDGALATLDAGIQQNPKDDGLKLIKLKILGDRNDAKGVEAVLRDLIAQAPANNSYKIGLARLLLSQDDPGGAEKVFRDAIAKDPDNKDLKLLLVQFLLEQRGLSAAEKELLALSSAYPDDISYSLSLADVYVQNGKPKEAKELLKRIASNGDDSPNALRAKVVLARLAVAEGDKTAANALLTEILAIDRENADALLIRAEMKLAAKDIQSAIPDLRIILRADPRSTEALRLLIRAYTEGGEPQLALNTYRSYLDVDSENDDLRIQFSRRLMEAHKIDEAEKQVRLTLQHSPTFLPALLLQIDQFIGRGSWAEAANTAQALISSGNQIDGGTALGKVYLAKAEFKKAIRELRHVTELVSGPSEARRLLVHALTEDGQGSEAVELLTKATAANTADAEAFALLGDVYFKLDRPDDAQRALEKSIRIAPKWDLPYLKLISLNIKTNHQDRAIEAAQAGLKELPNHVQLLLNLAMMEDARDQFDAAQKSYEAVLRQQPRNVIAANNLAALIADAWPDDKTRLEQASRLAEPFRNMSDPSLLDTLGWVQYRLGNIDDAIAILERSAKAKPDQAQIRYHLGMAYKARGNQAEAKHELELATANQATYRGLDNAILALATP